MVRLMYKLHSLNIKCKFLTFFIPYKQILINLIVGFQGVVT